MKNGFFKPSVSQAAKTKRANKINAWNEYRQQVEKDSDEDEPSLVTAADIMVEELPIQDYETYKEFRATTRL